MKKNIVLFILFILPIVAYLFFATGVNGFTRLPIITEKISDFGNWKSLNGDKITLNNKITILGFGGYNLLENRGNLFNLNQKIYQQYHTFKDLQFVIICPLGVEKDVKIIKTALSKFTDVSQWQFVFTTSQEIQNFYNEFKINEKLDTHFGSSNVYIIDKERNLRGRKNRKMQKIGYDTFHPADLSNEMLDDFKIILYEYRAALKKNHNATKQL